MPYHPESQFTKKANAKFATNLFLNTGQVFWSNSGTITSTADRPIYSLTRTGTNSSIPELIKVYGKGAVEFRKKKVFVGVEYRSAVKLIWYLTKGGFRRSRKVSFVKKVKVYKTITRAYVIQHGIGKSNETGFFLKPNDLHTRIGVNLCTPSEFSVEYRRWTGSIPGGFWDKITKFNVTGPGRFTSTGSEPTDIDLRILFDPVPVDPTVPTIDIDHNALRRFYSKVASEVPDYLTAAAESGELVRTLTNIVKESIKLVKEIKLLDLKRLKGRLHTSPEELSGLWLTWVYGLAPVVEDITKTIDVVKHADRTWRSYSASSSDLTTSTIDPSSVSMAYGASVEHTRTFKYGAIIEGRLTVDRVYRDQVNWQSAVGTVYELIPFSFMLDWIVNISEYLKSAQIFEDKVYHAWKTKVIKRQSKFKGRLDYNPIYPAIFLRTDELEAFSFGLDVERTRIGTIPDMPDIKVKKPASDVLTVSRAINSLAILLARTDGLKRPL